jgi:hypothetical protein
LLTIFSLILAISNWIEKALRPTKVFAKAAQKEAVFQQMQQRWSVVRAWRDSVERQIKSLTFSSAFIISWLDLTECYYPAFANNWYIGVNT